MGGAGDAELVGGVGAGGDAPDGEAGGAAGFDVPSGVADEEGFGGSGVELRERVLGELEVGFEPRGVGGAENTGEERGDFEVVADEAGGRAVFVGEDGELGAAGVEFFEEFAGAGEEGDVVEHGGVPIGAVDREGFGDAVGADEAAEGELEAAADGVVDLFEGRRREAEFLHRVRVATMDGGEVIDEGAVEVEEEGFERSHERGAILQSAGTESVHSTTNGHEETRISAGLRMLWATSKADPGGDRLRSAAEDEFSGCGDERRNGL